MTVRTDWSALEDRLGRLRECYRFLTEEGYSHLPIFDWVCKEMKGLRRRLNQHRYYTKHVVRSRAKEAVRRAVASGDLIRPNICEGCRKEGFVDAHHDSYAVEVWVNVKWLCRKCHRTLHQGKEKHDD